MTELRRLLDSSETPGARELLRSGLDDAPPPAAMGRVAAALGLTATAAAVAVPASAAALNGVAASGLATAGKASGVSGLLVGKWLASGLAAGALVSGTASVVEQVRAGSPAVHVAAPPPSAAPFEASRAPDRAPAAPVEAPAAVTPEASATATRIPAASSSASGTGGALAAPDASTSRALGVEAARIDSARQALARGDVRRALIELDWYERSRVVGVLDREAALLRIQALVRAGDGARAVELARAYLVKHPRDAYSARLAEVIRSGGATFPLGDGSNR